MDQWMVLKVVLHLLGPLGVRRHLEETTKGASAILMSKYTDDELSIILGYLWFLIVWHKKCMNIILLAIGCQIV